MRQFIEHYIVGLVCLLVFGGIAFGISILIGDYYGGVILLSFIPAFGVYLYLTSIFENAISVIQYFLLVVFSSLANGLLEPQYHFLFNYNNGKVFDITIMIIAGVTINTFVKLLLDMLLKLFTSTTRQSRIEKYLQRKKYMSSIYGSTNA